MRFSKQRTLVDCAPVALANALKWAGKDVSYSREKAFWYEAVGCDPRAGGTSWWTTGNSFAREGEGFFSVVTLHNPLVKEIEEHLLSGGALVLSYLFFRKKVGRVCRHIVLVPEISKDKQKFRVINQGSETDKFVSRETFIKYFLRFRRKTNPTTVYLLSKEKG